MRRFIFYVLLVFLPGASAAEDSLNTDVCFLTSANFGDISPKDTLMPDDARVAPIYKDATIACAGGEEHFKQIYTTPLQGRDRRVSWSLDEEVSRSLQGNIIEVVIHRVDWSGPPQPFYQRIVCDPEEVAQRSCRPLNGTSRVEIARHNSSEICVLHAFSLTKGTWFDLMGSWQSCEELLEGAPSRLQAIGSTLDQFLAQSVVDE